MALGASTSSARMAVQLVRADWLKRAVATDTAKERGAEDPPEEEEEEEEGGCTYIIKGM